VTPPPPSEVLEMLGKTNVRKVFFALAKRSIASPTELIFELRLQPNQVHEALRELVQENLVKRDEKDNPKLGEPWVFYGLTSDGIRVAEAVERIGPV